MRKVDIILALITGEITAWFFWGLLKNIGLDLKLVYWVLPIVFPILAIAALWIAYLIGKKFLFVFQIAKFLLIGVLATLLDLGVLNILMWISGIAAGLGYTVFKSISFIVATIGKYFGNKFWAFKKMEKAGMRKEFSQFFLVTLIGFGLNVGIASLVVNVIGSQFGLSATIWANVGGIIAAFAAATWNFIGYKFIVFKK